MSPLTDRLERRFEGREMGRESKVMEVALSSDAGPRPEVVAALKRSGLVEYLSDSAGGPFGQTALTLGLLEAFVHSAGLGLVAGERLRTAIIEELTGGVASFALPQLRPEHRQLTSTFEIVVLIDALCRRVEALCGVPPVEGSLRLDGLRELLEAEFGPGELLQRVLRLARAFAERQPQRDRAADESEGGARIARESPETGAVSAVVAFFLLLRRSLLELARTSAVRPLVAALDTWTVQVAGYRYSGLEIQAVESEPSGLLSVSLDDIVGNEAFREAGARLARDVAGYDLERRRNPKHVNPVLFGLGRPGSGKTVTAHAVGNYFLDYCRERDVPARFLTVRRTDWASSYQNASAQNLVRFFREEVHAFDGVCGVYWPDIDTAFASRDNTQLRQEEKQNLGAVFGIFDGTLLPRDGKWFLICDANTLHMDEATISRIAQNPVRVEGPVSAEDYVRLMREILLRDLVSFVPDDEAAWQRIGRTALELDLSGRNVDSLCANLRARIQDFEFPEEYFRVDAEERDRIVASLGQEIDEELILESLHDFAAFRRKAEIEAEQSRFEGEVEMIVRRLNASRAAAVLTGAEGE